MWKVSQQWAQYCSDGLGLTVNMVRKRDVWDFLVTAVVGIIKHFALWMIP